MADASMDGSGAATIFQEEWRTYREVVDNNYLFHREAYGCLGRFLLDEFDRPFSFLDIACGDAGPSAAALSGTRMAQYVGIDLSDAALEIAAGNLADLKRPFALHRADFRGTWPEFDVAPDVVWIGLSLHHLRQAEKLAFMRRLHALLANHGVLIVYENAGPDGDTRAEWMSRWDGQRPAWTDFDDREWEAITDHVHENDFPETRAGWHELGGMRDAAGPRSCMCARRICSGFMRSGRGSSDHLAPRFLSPGANLGD